MGLRDIAETLIDRAAHAGLEIPEPLASRLVVYYEVLTHWNDKINLTSLSNQDEAVDRLLLEPVAAAAMFPRPSSLVDLGSGGGSPALPLALALDVPRVLLVESRVRKAAFLREALREVGIPGIVEDARFETVAAREGYQGTFGLCSVRAVRLDGSAFAAISALLDPRGRAALFRSADQSDPPEGLPDSLRWEFTRPLLPASRSTLVVLSRRA